MSGLRSKRGLEPAVVGVARRERIDVKRALDASRDIKRDEDLANELVRIAIDADRSTVNALLHAVARIRDEMLRAETLVSLFRRTSSRFAREPTESAQDVLFGLVSGMEDEAARVTALRNLSSDLPDALRGRLAALSAAITDPVHRLQVAVCYEGLPSRARAREFLETAKAIADQEQRGRALAAIAQVIPQSQLAHAFAAAKAIEDADVAALPLIKISGRFEDPSRRQRAHAEILAVASSIKNPARRFDVMAALRDLPGGLRESTELALFDLAARFDAPEIRCRAMLVTGEFAQDEALRQRALLASIAAAECVWDEQRRSELFLLLRPGAPQLPPAVRRELTRAVERLENRDVYARLCSVLGRFFIYERPQAPGGRSARRGRDTWDIFISYATADRGTARFLASELTSRGVRVFLSADTIDAAVGSNSWMKAIDKALVHSRAVLVLLTPHALASKWVEEEWRKYYRLTVDTESGVLFSLRLGGPPVSELPLTRRMYQCIDSATGQIEPGHLTRILDIVRGV